MKKKLVLAISIVVVALVLVGVILALTLGSGDAGKNNNNSSLSGNNSSQSTPTEYKAGDIVKVPIEITKNPGIIIAKTIVKFDASALEYIECEKGLFTDNTVSAVDGKATCLLTANISKDAKDITETGTAATLVFRIKEIAKAGDYAFSVDTENSQYANLNESFVNPEVSVISKITIK